MTHSTTSAREDNAGALDADRGDSAFDDAVPTRRSTTASAASGGVVVDQLKRSVATLVFDVTTMPAGTTSSTPESFIAGNRARGEHAAALARPDGKAAELPSPSTFPMQFACGSFGKPALGVALAASWRGLVALHRPTKTEDDAEAIAGRAKGGFADCGEGSRGVRHSGDVRSSASAAAGGLKGRRGGGPATEVGVHCIGAAVRGEARRPKPGCCCCC